MSDTHEELAAFVKDEKAVAKAVANFAYNHELVECACGDDDCGPPHDGCRNCDEWPCLPAKILALLVDREAQLAAAKRLHASDLEWIRVATAEGARVEAERETAEAKLRAVGELRDGLLASRTATDAVAPHVRKAIGQRLDAILNEGQPR